METAPAIRYTVILFYKFFAVENPAAFRDDQRALAEACNLKGRMLVATEGVNATFEGTDADVERYKAALKRIPALADMLIKESAGTGKAFRKLEVKVRPEVVTLGAGAFDVAQETAPTLESAELERMYERGDDFVVLDLRNDYEIAVGKFDKTIDPALHNFRDLPAKLPELAHLKDKKVVTVCTGGIRCEKATCLLKREGFTDVVQLKDGIHTYMQQYPGKHFRGSLFVFDNRITTTVVDTPQRDIIGTCAFCGARTEDFYNDDTVRPSRKVICCRSCIGVQQEVLRTT
ncbi:MAG: hypothetical protein RLZZ342_38 [Candidatus Parcubacteria bacterium]|jgi:UPF0176 protein